MSLLGVLFSFWSDLRLKFNTAGQAGDGAAAPLELRDGLMPGEPLIVSPDRLKGHEPHLRPMLLEVCAAEPSNGRPGQSKIEETLETKLALAVYDLHRMYREGRVPEHLIADEIQELLQKTSPKVETLLDLGREANTARKGPTETVEGYLHLTPAKRAKQLVRQERFEAFYCLVDSQHQAVRLLAIGYERAKSFYRGDRGLARKKRRGEYALLDMVAEFIFGPPDEQERLHLDCVEMAVVAFFGHVNPALIWPEFSHLRLTYELCVLSGQLYCGYATEVSVGHAETFGKLLSELPQSGSTRTASQVVTEFIFDYLNASVGLATFRDAACEVLLKGEAAKLTPYTNVTGLKGWCPEDRTSGMIQTRYTKH